MRKLIKSCKNKSIIWNTKCKDGWKKYQQMTEENQELVNLLDNDHLDSTQLVAKIDSVMTKKILSIWQSNFQKCSN